MRAVSRVAAAVFTLVCGLAATGCADSGSQPVPFPVPPTSATAPTTVPPSSATTAATGRTVVAGDVDNGRTLTVATGDRLQVRLGNTYWKFGAVSESSVLRLAGQPSTAASPIGPSGCVPGAGCGVVTATFDAVAAGRATVTASRTTCGEARGCVGDQGSYRLTVLVR
jgi:hypothetical protein